MMWGGGGFNNAEQYIAADAVCLTMYVQSSLKCACCSPQDLEDTNASVTSLYLEVSGC
jgi:cytochrome c-type biogenesis protein CcmH/NrfF